MSGWVLILTLWSCPCRPLTIPVRDYMQCKQAEARMEYEGFGSAVCQAVRGEEV